MVANIKNAACFVLDASFILSYLLPDEESEYVKAMFTDFQEGKIDFISATLLPYEVINGIRSAIIRKRMTAGQAKSLIKDFFKLDFVLERVNEKEVLNLSLSKQLSTYDASYLWLAKEKGVKLLTLDEKIKNL